MTGAQLATVAPSRNYVEVGGLRFHCLRLGSGEPDRPRVVMIHGLIVGDVSNYYMTIANAVARHADVYLYDLRGHGLSSVPERGYRVSDHLGDLLGLLEAWGWDGPVHLVGNSYGGLIALELARRQPARVASMLMIEAHFPIEGWGDEMVGTVGLAAYGLDEENTRRWLDEQAGRKVRRLLLRANRLAVDTSIMDDLLAEPPFPLAALKAVHCPVTALYGAGSDIVERGRDLERHIPGARLHVVAGAEHGLLHEQAAEVRRHAVEWITAGTGR